MTETLTARCRAALLCAVVTAGLAVTGCATVQPWQRGLLSREPMMFDADPARAAYAEHWMTAREGSSGGFGLQGGGCGCE